MIQTHQALNLLDVEIMITEGVFKVTDTPLAKPSEKGLTATPPVVREEAGATEIDPLKVTLEKDRRMPRL